jgi:hypothetical protein
VKDVNAFRIERLYTADMDKLFDDHFTVLMAVYYFYKGDKSHFTRGDVLKLLNDCDLWNQEVRSNPTNLSPVCTLRGVGLAWLGCRLDGRGRVDLVTKPRAEESKY